VSVIFARKYGIIRLYSQYNTLAIEYDNSTGEMFLISKIFLIIFKFI